jgi:hypothetical protein
LEAANAHLEIIERDSQRLVAELKAAQAREQATKETAEATIETAAEAARVHELAANAMAEGTRRVARQTSVWLTAALLLALISFTTGIYASLKLAQLKGHQDSINAMAVAPDELKATRAAGPRTRSVIIVHVR